MTLKTAGVTTDFPDDSDAKGFVTFTPDSSQGEDYRHTFPRRFGF